MIEEATPGACSTPCSDNAEPATVDAFGLQLQQPDSTDYVLGFSWPFGGTISSLTIQTGLGSGTATVKINDIPVEGLEEVVINTGERTYAATGNNVFIPGDDIILEIVSGGGGIVNLSATVPFSRGGVIAATEGDEVEDEDPYGLTPIVQDQDYVDIEFDVGDEQDNNEWTFDALEIEYPTDPPPEKIWVAGPIIKSTTGARVYLNASPSDGLFTARWRL